MQKGKTNQTKPNLKWTEIFKEDNEFDGLRPRIVL